MKALTHKCKIRKKSIKKGDKSPFESNNKKTTFYLPF